MARIARWLLDNLGLFVLAAVCGFVAWALVSLNQDPIISRTLDARVVRIGERDRPDVSIFSSLPATVAVGVYGPRSSITSLEQQGLQIPIDFRRFGPGVTIVPLTPTLGASPIELRSVQPSSATVVLTPLASKSYAVGVSVVGTPAVGFRVGPVQSVPAQIAVTGTQEAISRIVTVGATVSVEGARSSVDQTARVFARDAEGNALSTVQLSSDVVAVRIVLEQLGNYRDLPVVLRWRGQPADGFAVTGITVEPQIVTVFGAVDAIQALKGFVETQDVVIAGAKADVDEKTGLIMPPGVSLVSDAISVRARIRIEPVTGSRTLRRRPVTIGATQGLSTTISPDTINLVVNGPLPQLNSLTEDDVRVLVDLTGLPAGNFQLTPRVILPDGIAVQSLVPSTVQVELAAQRRQP